MLIVDPSRVPVRGKLNDTPSLAQPYFETFQAAGANACCIVGSAVRDADCAEHHEREIRIDSYDIHVGVGIARLEENKAMILYRLLEQYAVIEQQDQIAIQRPWPLLKPPRRDLPSYGMLYLHQRINLYFHPMPDTLLLEKDPSALLAQQCVTECDINLNAIALDANFKAWALPQYFNDRDCKTMTMRPTDHDPETIAQAKELHKKYPDFERYLPF